MRYFLLITIIFLGLLYAAGAHAGIIFKPVFHTGLVGYWDFQEGAGDKAYDKSGNDNDGDLNGDTSWADGKLGTALDLDEDGEYIYTGDDTSLQITTITISAWVKFNNINQVDQSIFSGIKQTSPWGGYNLIINRNGLGCATGDICFWVSENSGSNYDYVEVAHGMTQSDTWYHIVGVWNNSNKTATYYINGTLIGSASSAYGIVHDAAFESKIGRAGEDGFNLNGIIDEVRIYNRALSAGEVERLYKLSQPTVMAPTREGLVGYWPFEEGTGTKAGDHSGQGNHGDWNGTGSHWTDGKLGTGGNFNGSDDYVEVTDSPLLTVNTVDNVTYMAWVKLGASPVGYDNIMGDWAGPCFQFNGNQLNYYAGLEKKSNTLSWTVGQWYHVVVVVNNTASVTWYRDSVNVGSVANSGQSNKNPDVFGIGGTSEISEWFDGIIDEVRIYNRALEASEIEALYKSGRAKINASQNDKLTDGLVGLWSFNGPDMDGDDAFDRSGQNNHGTLQNGPVPATGRIGQALDFDGDNDYVDVGNALDFASTDFTLSAWIKIDDFTDQSAIISKEVNILFWRVETDGSLAIWDRRTPTGQAQTAASLISLGTWYHVAVVFSDSTNKAIQYIDGAFTPNSLQDDNMDMLSSSDSVIIGYRIDPADPFDGIIDEVRIYDRVLSAEEIQRLYNMGR